MGIFDNEVKNFTALTFADIYTKDETVPKFQHSLIMAGNNMKQYNNNFFQFKRLYRGRYTPNFLRRNGFMPIHEGNSLNLDQGMLFQALQAYDPQAVRIDEWRLDAGLLDEQVAFFIEQNAESFGWEWSSYEWTLIKEYTGSNKDELCCSGSSEIVDPEGCDQGSGSGSGSPMPISCKAKYNKIDVKYANVSNDPDIPDDLSMLSVEFSNCIEPRIEHFTMEIPNLFIEASVYVVYRKAGSDDFYHFIITSTNLMNQSGGGEAKEFSAIIPIKEKGVLNVEEDRIKKMLRKYSIKPDDLIEAFSGVDSDGEPEIDHAYLLTGVKMLDIYDVKPGTYEAKDAQYMSLKLIRKADKVGDGSAYVISSELSEKWKRKNRLRRRKYANMMYDLVQYYGSGITTIKMSWTHMHYMLKFREETVSGVLPGAIKKDGSISHKHAEIEFDKNAIINRPYTYFRPYGRNRCMYGEKLYPHSSLVRDHCPPNQHTDAEIDSIHTGGTLPVTCPAIVIRKQINESYYTEIVITDLMEVINVEGHFFTLYADGRWFSDSAGDENKGGPGEKFPRFVYPLELLNDLDFMSFVLAKEYGQCFMVYAIKQVETKWYEKFVGVILAVVFCIASIYFGGQGCTMVSLIIQMVVGYAIKFALTVILSHIDNPFLRALVQIVATVATFYFTGKLDFTAENFLPLASQVTKIVINTKMEIDMRKLKEEREYQENMEAASNIEDSIDAMLENDGPGVSKADMSSAFSYVESSSGDAVFYKSIEGLYNFDQFYDVTGALDIRKQVTSG